MSFRRELEAQSKGITPGLKLLVLSKGQKKTEINIGKTYPYYDLASVTKPVFTVTAMMKLYELNKNILNQTVRFYCPWFENKKIRIEQLLNHSSKLFWWKPFYKKIDLDLNIQDRWTQVRQLIRNEQPTKTNKCIYSDLNYMLLASILENAFNKDLITIWNELNEDLELQTTHFNVHNKRKYAKSKYAPTELCPWRQRRMQGEVHDENTWALGGVSSHAGLFSSIEDISKWGNDLLKIYKGKNSYLKSATVKQFFKRSVPQNIGDWSYGFMMPSKTNSSAGDLLSKRSVGFLGFTGTSFWIDPVQDLQVYLFTNRVYYGRQNKIFNLRQFVHNNIATKLELK